MIDNAKIVDYHIGSVRNLTCCITLKKEVKYKIKHAKIGYHQLQIQHLSKEDYLTTKKNFLRNQKKLQIR